jgi:hypothetical protein
LDAVRAYKQETKRRAKQEAEATAKEPAATTKGSAPKERSRARR